jgi:hypothetical protein
MAQTNFKGVSELQNNKRCSSRQKVLFFFRQRHRALLIDVDEF